MEPSVEVAQAVEEYMTENGFTRAEYTAKTVTFYAGSLSFRVPNPKGRQRLVPLHDIHHVVTGYGTDVIGEGEQGIWELRAGCPSPLAIFYNSLATVGAFFLSPRRVIRAFVSAENAETLYGSPIHEEAAQAMTLGELRVRLGVPADGVANRAERQLHSHAPKMRFADRAAS